MSTRTRGGRRCLTPLLLRVQPTLVAADQVAGEFGHAHRLEFLAQAVRREHEDVTQEESEAAARIYVFTVTA